MSDEIKDLKDVEYEKLDLDGEAAEKPERGGGAAMAWLPGLILIIVGVVVLLNNFTDIDIDNWWAFFILIPAFGSLGNFWRIYRTEGRANKDARGSLIFGLIMTLVAAAFLLNLDWGLIWPAFLILAGIGALLGGLLD